MTENLYPSKIYERDARRDHLNVCPYNIGVILTEVWTPKIENTHNTDAMMLVNANTSTVVAEVTMDFIKKDMEENCIVSGQGE